MGFLDSLFGWRHRTRRLRKKWDRLREKSLGKSGPLKKLLLEKLDLAENNLKVLEERQINRIERARLAKEVEIALAEVKELLNAKPDELQSLLRPQQERNPSA